VAKIKKTGSIFGDIGKEAKMAGSMEFRFSSMNFRLRYLNTDAPSLFRSVTLTTP